MKLVWQIIAYLVLGTFLIFATTIWQAFRYYFGWETSKQWIEFSLDPIWRKAGLIEIRGGAETGKTLLIVLLTQYLKGRKWSNVPNIVPGWQRLKLSTLKNHWLGEYEEGLVGVNNILLIDESWYFFSNHELNRYNLNKKSLGSLMFFLSETSKTNFKIFYVAKQGARLPEAFDLLSANKSATIHTLGVRHYCHWWKKNYYYLDIEFITSPNKIDSIKKKSTKYAVETDDHRIKKSPKSWWKLWQKNESKIISIPFSENDLRLFDKTWNLDSDYARNRMKSIVNKFAADGLIEGLKYKQSRTQRLQEENEALLWYKRHPDPNQKKQLRIKGVEIMKDRGLWKSAYDKIEEEETNLKKQLEEGGLSLIEYKEKTEKLAGRKTKLTETITKQQQKLLEIKETESNSLQEVPIKETPNKKKKPQEQEE